MRLQNVMLQLQWYDLTIKYRKGKNMHVSDALSRAYLPCRETNNDDFADDTIRLISVRETKYADIQSCTLEELAILKDTIKQG